MISARVIGGLTARNTESEAYIPYLVRTYILSHCAYAPETPAGIRLRRHDAMKSLLAFSSADRGPGSRQSGLSSAEQELAALEVKLLCALSSVSGIDFFKFVIGK